LHFKYFTTLSTGTEKAIYYLSEYIVYLNEFNTC